MNNEDYNRAYGFHSCQTNVAVTNVIYLQTVPRAGA